MHFNEFAHYADAVTAELFQGIGQRHDFTPNETYKLASIQEATLLRPLGPLGT